MTRMSQTSEVARAEAAIAHCRRLIERAQREIARREASGRSSHHAQWKVRTFQQLLREHEAYRRRLSEAAAGPLAEPLLLRDGAEGGRGALPRPCRNLGADRARGPHRAASGHSP